MVAISGSLNVERLAGFLLGVAAFGLASCGQTRAGGAPEGPAGGAGGASGGPKSVSPRGGTSSTGGAAGGSDGSVFEYVPRGAPIYTRAQRLTNSQFEHAAIDILRLPATTDLKTGLVPPFEASMPFTNNEHLLTMDEPSVLAFEKAAEKAAALATESSEALARLYTGTDAEGFVRELGRRAFRRPLSDAEVTRYTRMFARGEELYGAGFGSGAALVIRAMLASPSFLYRTELGPTGKALSGYEIAAKLSLWLLDTTPSDELLDAAASGELDDVPSVLASARVMLDTPAASAMMRDFHRQLYRLDRFDGLAKPQTPGFSDAVADEAKEASARFFERIFEQNLGVREIFSASRGFVGPLLAPLYGQATPRELEERELGPERVGYFMQVPFLMVTSQSSEPDIIHRGGALAQLALCSPLGIPAAEIPPLPPAKPGQTNRQRVEEWTGACGVRCHNEYINPLGYAFEGFDAMGVPRETDHGLPIDTSGSFPFSDGFGTFADARELITKLADDDQVYACYGQMLAGYGLQRDLVHEDMPLIEALGATGRGGSSRDIALALIQDPAFRVRQKDVP